MNFCSFSSGADVVLSVTSGPVTHEPGGAGVPDFHQELVRNPAIVMQKGMKSLMGMPLWHGQEL